MWTGRGRAVRDWSRRHDGVAASPLVRAWVSGCDRVAGRLAWCPPAALTALGVLTALAVPAATARRGGWLVVAAALAVVAGLADALDGAVADAVADRIADTALLLALWVAGAPGWLAGLAAGTAFVGEYARARAGALGAAGPGAITVWERPTRIILVAMVLLGALAQPGPVVPSAGAAAGTLLGVVGLGQLLPALARQLTATSR